MSYTNLDEVTFHKAYMDAFGRQRSSHPTTLFSSVFLYGNEESLYFTDAVDGTATFLPNESSFLLSTGTQDGAYVTRETYRYFNYIPGMSQLIVMTGVISTDLNVVSEMGYYDDTDGVFFRHDNNGINIVLRSSVSGSPQEIIIPQSEWNIDTMDGNGMSEVNLDFTKSQIFLIDLQWLGVGDVRFGFDMGEGLVYCHKIDNSNLRDTVYMKTARLPLRYHIKNTAILSQPATMKQICSTVISEGGFVPHGKQNNYIFSKNIGTTWQPIISLQLRPDINGYVNRSLVRLTELSVLAETNDIAWEIVTDPVLTGDIFAAHPNPASVIDIDTSATASTNGIGRYGGFAGGGKTAEKDTTSIDDLELHRNQIITLRARALKTATDINIFLNWLEV